MKQSYFVLTRLWRYLGLYFLKPNDAINDTLTASLLTKLNWDGPIVELGSGDGVYSYVMHGGIFPFWFDRYLLTDLSKTDIYDSHLIGILKPLIKLSYPNIELAIDAKESHVKKIKEIGFAAHCKVSTYEDLPIPSKSVEKIFYYTPHGLADHKKALQEAARILMPGGNMLLLLFNNEVKNSFICYRLSKIIPGSIGRYFSRLDNGRHDEIANLSKMSSEWKEIFYDIGLRVKKEHKGLSCFAWKVYDTQTRPLLHFLIRALKVCPMPLRTIIKFIWMILFYPYIVIFYYLFSNEFLVLDKTNCYLAFQVEKIVESNV